VSSRAVVVLSLAAFASAAALRATDSLLPLLAGTFGTTAGGASAVITAFAIGYGLLQVVMGPIGDRIGKYRMVFLVTAVSAAGNLACAFAPSLPWLVAGRFVTGATVGAIVPLSIAWIGDSVAQDQRQQVLARFLVGHMIGIALAATASGWLGERHGWPAVFFALTALYVVIAVLLWTELRGNPAARQAAARGPLTAAFRRMAALTRRPWVRVMLVTVFFEGALLYGALAFAAYHAYTRFGVGLGASGSLLVAFAAGGLVFSGIAVRLLPRIGQGGMVIAGGMCMSAGFLGLAFAPGFAFAVPCVVVLGVGLYMMHNTLQMLATQMAPEARGGALALFATCLFTGQSAGVWLASHAVDAAGTVPAFIVAAAGLPLLALEFRRRLSMHRHAA
jgi:predicted MFS family arabinose efflux permease